MDNLGLYKFLNKWNDYISNVSDYEFKKNFNKMFEEYRKLDIFLVYVFQRIFLGKLNLILD